MSTTPERRSYLILLLATAMLLALQWAYPHIPFLREHAKNSRLLSYYLLNSEPDSLLQAGIDTSLLDQLDTLPDSSELLADTAIKSDSMPPIAYVDEAWFANDSVVIPDTANIQHLRRFFEALNQLPKKKKVRISYWGDSMIEGDLITQTLRRKYQARYGGSGVGFVPFISITAGFRRTVVHQYKGPWRYYSLVKNAKIKDAPYGYNGEYMLQGRDSIYQSLVAEFAAPKGKSGWQQAMVFYGKGSGKGLAKITLDKTKSFKQKLSDTNTVNVLNFSDSSMRVFRIQLDSAWNTILYGVSLESDSGVIVDNLSLRGNSGMAQTRISSQVLKGFNQHLKPNLIVLHFGINVINASTMKYGWYESAMTRVVRHYQRCFPEASILIIGVA
ncbi:MAG: hypothetical protein LPK45_07755, partial [Bacteroidota bacterium]|nr:hypothetical protein [Bacteroidota bacterium]MDX5430964.1 hypothetical protein [Bacteroidota bacterium]MDX5469715.1 hypothetical protein [Bacteroidota bacterium]